MKTILYDSSDLSEIIKQLKLGELIAFPTETVYGLGADATNESAVKNVFRVKNRPLDNPLTINVSGVKMLKMYVSNISTPVLKLLKYFWPGPLTVILNAPNKFLDIITNGNVNVGFRCPSNKIANAIIDGLGNAMVGPSANISGKPSPLTKEHVLHDLNGKIKGIVTNDESPLGIESTILDCTKVPFEIIRPGAVSKEEIETILQQKIIQNTEGQKSLKHKHYQTSNQLVMVHKEDWNKVQEYVNQTNSKTFGILATEKILSMFHNEKNIKRFSLGSNVKDATSNLFNGLRFFDDQVNVLKVFVQTFNGPDSDAYMNRLKSSANDVFFN